MKVHCNTANQESAFIAQVWRESQKMVRKWISLHKNDQNKQGGHYRINNNSDRHLPCVRLIVGFITLEYRCYLVPLCSNDHYY